MRTTDRSGPNGRRRHAWISRQRQGSRSSIAHLRVGRARTRIALASDVLTRGRPDDGRSSSLLQRRSVLPAPTTSWRFPIRPTILSPQALMGRMAGRKADRVADGFAVPSDSAIRAAATTPDRSQRAAVVDRLFVAAGQSRSNSTSPVPPAPAASRKNISTRPLGAQCRAFLREAAGGCARPNRRSSSRRSGTRRQTAW